MPDGGRLTIEAANTWLDARAARERDLPTGQYLSLRVTDTGTGMTPEGMSRAFDPFFTTKPLVEGAGLGLSMIYAFGRLSAGHFWIDFEPGCGTTLCLDLPRSNGLDDGGAIEIGQPAIPGAGRGETVLVIDDEPTVRRLVVDVLASRVRDLMIGK